MTFTSLERRVLAWAKDKGILDKATPLTQIEKTIEEIEETKEALEYQSKDIDTYINTKGKLCETPYEIKDGLGDTLVTLIIQCRMQNLNPLECLESALNIIEKRTGIMKNGQFVKDK